VHRLVNDLQGDKQLAIFWSTDIGDHLEEFIVRIFINWNPRLRKVLPEVIDEQEEAFGACVVYWVEREAKGFSDEDLPSVEVKSLCLSTLRWVEMSRHDSREVMSHDAFEHRRLVDRQGLPLRSQSEKLVGLRGRGDLRGR
jgi:hypothetical protein